MISQKKQPRLLADPRVNFEWPARVMTDARMNKWTRPFPPPSPLVGDNCMNKKMDPLQTSYYATLTIRIWSTELILCLRPANKKRRYKVMPSLIQILDWRISGNGIVYYDKLQSWIHLQSIVFSNFYIIFTSYHVPNKNFPDLSENLIFSLILN